MIRLFSSKLLLQSCANFMEIIHSFSEASGLSLNVQKSSLYFSANTGENVKGVIKSLLGMEENE